MDRQLLNKRPLEDAIQKLENDGLELWCNRISWVTNSCDYTIYSNKSIVESEWRKNKKGNN